MICNNRSLVIIGFFLIISLLSVAITSKAAAPNSEYLPILNMPKSATQAPTATNTPQPTELPPPQPTPTLYGVPSFCSCTGPDLDCADFDTHNQAQACFEHCVSLGYGDVYRLDGDNDGLACEALP